ncbi:DUF3388 domain-containing protein [Bacillus sp. P1(2020)]|uniref:DUF3388 domain-containing protein n=1 Tax=Pallidibacillus pasinlerensis TaxID=2703818 RepID=A0ABX0A5J7_9BACI|nr:DUF3388 domain-containing protein [Pallidibacillus pasinlerensis]NCU16463.1 DUF3388 domain-containing protein [Pallidibacillus pasinlerensis]
MVGKKLVWYLEYEININRPGLLGDISSLLGMLSINIITINGVDRGRRGLLILSSKERIQRLEPILRTMETIRLIKLREPTLRDRLAVRHGRYIQRDEEDKRTFRFVRDEIGLLVDFMSEIFKEEGHKLIGIRGMPRVGKTESLVAASVSANKRWIFISSTLLKQTIRDKLIEGEYDTESVFLIDGAVSLKRGNERHWSLIREIMQLPAIKVVEHPDLFVQKGEYSLRDFDYIIELRNNQDEEITYEMVNKQNTFFGFDF